MNALRNSIICVLIIASNTVLADPICTPSQNSASEIICTPGDDDYILKRGLVSDNNHTLKVTLRECRIIDIDYESFHGLHSLKSIDLSRNKISKIKLGALDESIRVTHLNLSYNLLTGFPLGIFDKNINLRVLDLKGNRIGDLELGVFDPLTKLKHLDLSGNVLLGSLLNPFIFDQSPQITFLDFSRNDMSDTDDNFLQAFQTLEFLSLDGSSLTEVPLFATRNNLRTMKKLLLSVNQISRLDNKDIFMHLESLEHLNIGWNILKSLHEDVFKPLKNLKTIYLRNNKLTQIPDSLFNNIRSLNTIDLSNNLITFVPVNAFRGTKVRNLNLANNRFTYLTDNFCLELRNSGAFLQKFYFHQNPWQCTCLFDILKEVKKFDIEYNSVKYDGKHPVCVSEENTCKRHDNFNEIYVDLYDQLIGKT